MIRKLVLVVLLGAINQIAHAAPITISASNFVSGANNLRVASIDGTTATNVSFGASIVGPAGSSGDYERPILTFANANFAALVGGSVTSAQLNFSTWLDFSEPGEAWTSEIRLASTGLTSVTSANRDSWAALTGAGGGATVIGSHTHLDGVFASYSINFDAASMAAIGGMINGSDATLAVSFIEFLGNDNLDEFAVRDLELVVTADVDIPEPSTVALLLLGLAMCARRRA